MPYANNSVTEDDLEGLNTRYLPDFEAPETDFYICLTTTNQMARDINGRTFNKVANGRSNI